MRILAYLDPGAGSIVVQAVVAGAAGVAVVLKLGWRRLISRIVRRGLSEPEAPPVTDPQEHSRV
jgi:hypothetical protein